ncbi:hypothetical protein NL676_023170 [Syzygium grande]|nr:hypothetical protein NL676_023170 [Syzygium grande]
MLTLPINQPGRSGRSKLADPTRRDSGNGRTDSVNRRSNYRRSQKFRPAGSDQRPTPVRLLGTLRSLATAVDISSITPPDNQIKNRPN